MIVENIKLARYDRIEDPGHSWLEVPICDVRKIGVLDKITPYSPKNADFIYLEEDCDMFTFVDAMKSKGYSVEMNRVNVDDFDSYLESV